MNLVTTCAVIAITTFIYASIDVAKMIIGLTNFCQKWTDLKFVYEWNSGRHSVILLPSRTWSLNLRVNNRLSQIFYLILQSALYNLIQTLRSHSLQFTPITIITSRKSNPRNELIFLPTWVIYCKIVLFSFRFELSLVSCEEPPVTTYQMWDIAAYSINVFIGVWGRFNTNLLCVIYEISLTNSQRCHKGTSVNGLLPLMIIQRFFIDIIIISF